MSASTQAQAKDIRTLQQENKMLRRYLETVQELYWASQTITSAENLLYALNQLLYKVMSVIDAKDGSISRFDETSDELVFMLVHGELGRQLPDFRIKSDIGIAGWVVSNRQPIIVNTPHEDTRFSHVVDKEFGFFTQCIMSAPIMRRGKLKGVVQLLNKRGNEFNQTDVVLLLTLGQVAAIVFEEITARHETVEEEVTDMLAPLP